MPALLSSLVFQSCKQTESHMLIPGKIKETPMPSSIRALQALDESTCWFAGSGGMYGYTTDKGVHWVTDSLTFDTIPLHFRSIAVTESAVHLLSVGSPALLFRSEDQGLNWELVYREDHPAAFYDAMKFWDEQRGIAVGDPTDGCISILLTKDGGKSWEKSSCDAVPPAAEGEAAFAASNSNIAVVGDQCWIATGGKEANILHSADGGVHWEKIASPIIQGEMMTGIFSIDFLDAKNGIVFGGNWEEKTLNRGNKAVTTDGGKSWRLVAEGAEPGYRSRVLFESEFCAAVGSPGISWSHDQGLSWQLIDSAGWYTAERSGNSIWFAGDQRLGRAELLKGQISKSGQPAGEKE